METVCLNDDHDKSQNKSCIFLESHDMDVQQDGLVAQMIRCDVGRGLRRINGSNLLRRNAIILESAAVQRMEHVLCAATRSVLGDT